MNRSAAARKAWETRRRRKAIQAVPRRVAIRSDPHRELLERIQALEVRAAEHYCLIRALEERTATAPRPRPAKEPDHA